jgi:hypothetical protein
MAEQKQLENVEYFKYLGRKIANNGSFIHEIKSRIAMPNAAFNEKKTPFTSNLE